MFNVEFLHIVREFEFNRILDYLTPGAEILEIGGGTGYQAKRLQEHGFCVTSIDLPESLYFDKMVFPVKPYDGKTLPFENARFDIVFSSNVLEHVLDVQGLCQEMKRVLKADGVCLHVMPTASWRLWTSVAHYIEFFQKVVLTIPKLIPRSLNRAGLRAVGCGMREIAGLARNYAIVPRHGEKGNALTELCTFSAAFWKANLRKAGFHIEKSEPMGLFYTGHMVLGKRLPLSYRCRMAHIFGSSCQIYRVRPMLACENGNLNP